MSLVSVVAREQFISLMTDGRVRGAEGIVIDESYPKYQMLGNKGFVAITGSKEHGEELIRIAKDFYDEGYDFHAIADGLQQIMIRDIPRAKFPHVRVQMIVGGIMKRGGGEIAFFSLTNKNETVDQMVKSYPRADDVSYSYADGVSPTTGINLEELLLGCLQKSGVDTIEQIQKAQEEFNKKVSVVDDSVNNNLFKLVLEK
jgi:hypothetical protein